MQFKKHKIKNKLLKSAKEEFLKSGFEKASIRTIVKNADTTIGNFYNYFKSKEDIFIMIVEKTHGKIMYFIKNHKAQDEDPFVLNSLNSTLARNLVSGAMGLFTQSFIENLILLADCSQGTRYADTKNAIIRFIHGHFLEHANIINLDYEDKGIGLLLSKQFVTGTLFVLRQDATASEKANIFTEYLLFYAYGMANLLSKNTEKAPSLKEQ